MLSTLLLEWDKDSEEHAPALLVFRLHVSRISYSNSPLQPCNMKPRIGINPFRFDLIFLRLHSHLWIDGSNFSIVSSLPPFPSRFPYRLSSNPTNSFRLRLPFLWKLSDCRLPPDQGLVSHELPCPQFFLVFRILNQGAKTFLHSLDILANKHERNGYGLIPNEFFIRSS